ncbi:hypothetical protein HRQ51_00055, partial [Escherichia coli]|nr:hypothetical protein [Escherichia coli]
MIWQPEFTDKTLSRKPGAVQSASFVPVETESDPMNVTFDKLAPEVQNAVMVKFDTCENITVDMVI